MSSADAQPEWAYLRNVSRHQLTMPRAHKHRDVVIRLASAGVSGLWQWEVTIFTGRFYDTVARVEVRGKLADAKAEAEMFARYRGWLK